MKQICRAGIYNDSKHLLNSTYRRAHTQSHTKRKETRSFDWTLQPMRETSWGSESGWHLWVIEDPSRKCGTCGSCRPVWQIVAFTKQARTPRNSHREQTAADSGSVNKLPQNPTSHHQNSFSSTRTLVHTPPLAQSVSEIYLLPHGEGPWRESSRCPSLIGLRPHPTGAEPWPLFRDPIFSMWLRSRRVTVSMLRWCKS